MSRQFWQESLSWNTASGTAVANTTTETILFPNVTIPANYMQDGRTLRIVALGQYSTTGTPTGLISLRWGGVSGVLLCKTVATTLGSGVTAALWSAEIWATVQTNGSSGKIMANGLASFGSALTQAVGSATGAGSTTHMSNGGVLTPAQASVDLTADTALSITWTWGTSSASNTVTGLNYYIESMN